MEVYVKVDGGIGRVIAATGAVQAFALKHPELSVNVVSSHPSLFYGIDGIKRVYDMNQPYLYEDYISKGEYLEPEPYNHSLYYKDYEHLSTVFNFLLTGKREFVQPKLVLMENEKNEAEKSITDIRRQSGKKVMFIQPWGSQGGVVSGNTVMADETYRSFGFEFYKKFVEKYKNEYHILSVQNNQYQMPGTFAAMNPDIRRVIACIPYVDLIVSCDSFLHHASAALGTPVPTVVLWGGTSAKNLGYENHINIVTKKPVLNEPNRIIHNHAIYVTNNKGCNDFDIEEVVSKIPQTTTTSTTGCGGCSHNDCFDYASFIEKEKCEL